MIILIGNGNGNGNGKKRGSAREAAHPLACYNTKPLGISDKQGSSGKVVELSANYFLLNKKPTFDFNQYRVDFEPVLDQLILRKAFVRRQSGLLGGYLFDGDSLLYLTHRLAEDRMEFEVESREGVHYKMVFKKTGMVIKMTDGMATQVLNVILRRLMDGLKMQLVGRHMYDPENMVKNQNYITYLFFF